MPYTTVSDFKFGMDRRRPQSSGVPGTLWELRNAVITRGGDIEAIKDFVPIFELPEGTFDAYSVRKQIFTFGSGSTPSGMPVGVRYQQLIGPSTPTMTEVLDAKGFDGKVYVIAAYDDGNIYHFYNATRVTAWDGLADAAASAETVATRLALLINSADAYRASATGAVVEITARVPGTGFTLATDTTENGVGTAPTAVSASVQANVAAVAETLATGEVEITGGSQSAGVNRVTSVTVDGTQLLAAPVDWIDSNDATANALSTAINNNSNTSGYTASAAGAVVTISAAVGTGAGPNGDVVAAAVGGTVTVTTANMSGGVTTVAPIAQVNTVTIGAGTFGPTDMWEITLDGDDYRSTGRASATGTSAHVNKRRIYSTAGSLVRYCKLNDPTDWTDTNTSTGAGFINISSEVEGAENLIGMAKYESYTAIFAENAIAIYDLQADAALSSVVQVLDNTGTLAPRALVAQGSNDVFYLDETGVRSLRTRDSVNSAYASDVGSAIDPFVQELLAEVGRAKTSRSSAVIEATDGRYMLAIGHYVVFLSQFPSSRIVAWSYVDFGENVTSLIRVGRAIYLRAGDTIYAYGGLDGDTYPDPGDYPAFVETPFISSKDPAGEKSLRGFDMAGEGAWRVQILVDPNDKNRMTDGGVIEGTTYHLPAIKIPGQTSHFALRFTCKSGGKATLSSTAVHHSSGRKE